MVLRRNSIGREGSIGGIRGEGNRGRGGKGEIGGDRGDKGKGEEKKGGIRGKGKK